MVLIQWFLKSSQKLGITENCKPMNTVFSLITDNSELFESNIGQWKIEMF